MIKKTIPIILLLIIIVSASLIPFLYESPSMFYKIGFEKTLLRIGKIVGLLGVISLILQPVLNGNFKILINIYGRKTLFNLHRKTGFFILGIALLHPFLILWSNDFVFFPFQKDYWAEYAGIFLSISLIPFILIAAHKKRFGLNYKSWKLIHITGAQIIFIIMFLHVFNVSTSFKSGIPYNAILIVCLTTVFLLGRKLLSLKK